LRSTAGGLCLHAATGGVDFIRRWVTRAATAKTHVARIPQKLDLRDRVQAVIYAYETGLVAPGSRQ
jgi:hypothetical protein